MKGRAKETAIHTVTKEWCQTRRRIYRQTEACQENSFMGENDSERNLADYIKTLSGEIENINFIPRGIFEEAGDAEGWGLIFDPLPMIFPASLNSVRRFLLETHELILKTF